MIELINFIIKVKVKNTSILVTCLNIAVCIIMFISGVFFSYSVRYFIPNYDFYQVKIINIVGIIFSLLIVIKFISSNKRKNIIPSCYPINFLKNALIESLLYITTSLWGIVAIFILGASFFLKYMILELIVLLCAIELAICINRSNNLIKKVFLFTVFYCILSVCVFKLDIGKLLFIIELFLLLILTSIHICQIKRKEEPRQFQKNISILKAYDIYYYLNRKSLNNLLLALIFKSVFILIEYIMYIKKGKQFLPPILLSLFFSPVLYFTFCLNNFFGYNKEMWLCITSKLSNRYFIRNILLIYLAVILIDQLLFTPIIIFLLGEKLTINDGLFQINSAVICLLIGLISSFNEPRKFQIKESFKTGTNATSPLYSITLISTIGLLSIVKQQMILELSFFTIALSCLFFEIYLFKKYSYKVNERIYTKLFRT